MRQGRFITTTVAAVAALAIGPASALATPGSFTDDNYGDFAAGHCASAWIVEPGTVRLRPSVTALRRTTSAGGGLPTGWTARTRGTPGGGTATVAAGA